MLIRDTRDGKMKPRPEYPDEVAEKLPKATEKARKTVLNPNVRWGPIDELQSIRAELIPYYQALF